jgi:hypothetical protein
MFKKTLVLSFAIFVVLTGVALAAEPTTARFHAANVSLGVFLGDEVEITNNGHSDVLVKCASSGDYGMVFFMEALSQQRQKFTSEAFYACFAVNNNVRQQISYNQLTFSAFVKDEWMPVLSFRANPNMFKAVGKAGVLTLNGDPAHYDAAPLWLYFPTVASVHLATIRHDLRDEVIPVQTRAKFYFPVYGSNVAECLLDTGIFVPNLSSQFWVTGDKTAKGCPQPAVSTGLVGYGITKLGNVVTPYTSGVDTSAFILWERAGKTFQ